MKETPMIFTGDSVRKILDGVKTQTRRVVKNCDGILNTGIPYRHIAHKVVDCEERKIKTVTHTPEGNPYIEIVKCPWKVGDRIWVKETFAEFAGIGDSNPWVYRATSPEFDIEPRIHLVNQKWRSPIYMPRAASRITLEITDVRVERLQSISEEDARAEGVPIGETHILASIFQTTSGRNAYRRGFYDAWDKINGKKHPWKSNPFVWVISFRLLEQTQ